MHICMDDHDGCYILGVFIHCTYVLCMHVLYCVHFVSVFVFVFVFTFLE